MNWKASPPAAEIAVAALSVACLGGAACFAVLRVAPLGAGWIEAGVAGACAALGGGCLIARVDRQPKTRSLEPSVESPGPATFADDVLLLDQRVDAEVLLLDDPLPDGVAPRVVRLFAAPATDEDIAPSLVGPGEMIARIETFLGQARDGASVASPPADAQAIPNDANSALHAALAEIRRSLRQG